MYTYDFVNETTAIYFRSYFIREAVYAISKKNW